MQRIVKIFAIFAIATMILGFTFFSLQEMPDGPVSDGFEGGTHLTASPLQSRRFSQPANPDAQSDNITATHIRATERISIPYGFDSPLPLSDAGHSVRVSGHGGCTKDQEVTVAVTVTQYASDAIATAELQQTCSGELQTWWVIAATDTMTPFVTGAAEGCGFATTRDDGAVTDTFDWCVDVELSWQLFLPLLLK